jgi:hypothetical protein
MAHAGAKMSVAAAKSLALNIEESPGESPCSVFLVPVSSKHTAFILLLLFVMI